MLKQIKAIRMLVMGAYYSKQQAQPSQAKWFVSLILTGPFVASLLHVTIYVLTSCYSRSAANVLTAPFCLRGAYVCAMTATPGRTSATVRCATDAGMALEKCCTGVTWASQWRGDEHGRDEED